MKHDFLDYTLFATSAKDQKSTKISHLPFEEEAAKGSFEGCLILRQTDGVITELGLTPVKESMPVWSSPSVNESRVSRHSTFSQLTNYSKKVLYMFNTKRIDETEYHVEVTKQFTDSYHLNVYVLKVDDVTDKDKIPIELFENDPTDFISSYVEDNLLINRKVGDTKNRISHLSINFPNSVVSGRKVDD